VLFDGASASLVGVALVNPTPRVIAAGVGTCDRLFATSETIYAGDSVAGTLTTVNYANGSVATQNVRVSRIVPSRLPGTVAVSFDASEPAWLVNAQGVSFVPAAAAALSSVAAQ
jgi:hypothetical protein